MRKGWLLIPILMVVLCLSLVPSLWAQDVADLTFGEPVFGELSAIQDRQLFQFEASAGDVVYLTMFSEEFVPYVRLFDPNEELIEEADSEWTVFFGPLDLLVDGIYTVIAGRADYGPDEGDFSLMIDWVDLQTFEPGDDESAQLESANHLAFYQVEMTGDALYSFQFLAENLGFYLFDPDGEFVLFDGHYDSPEIALYRAEKAGTYVLIVQTLLPEGVDYVMRVNRITPTPLDSTAEQTGEIIDDESLYFAFESKAGKTWDLNASIAVDGEKSLAVLALDSGDWWDTQIAYDGGSGPLGSARITPFIAPEDATYYVMLTYYSYDEEFDTTEYTLSLTPSSVLRIVPDIEFTGTVTPETGALTYLYDGQAGQILELYLERTSELGGLGVQLISPEGEIFSLNGGYTRSLTQVIQLPLDGVYQFYIWNSFYDVNEMSFALHVDVRDD